GIIGGRPLRPVRIDPHGHVADPWPAPETQMDATGVVSPAAVAIDVRERDGDRLVMWDGRSGLVGRASVAGRRPIGILGVERSDIGDLRRALVIIALVVANAVPALIGQ